MRNIEDTVFNLKIDVQLNLINLFINLFIFQQFTWFLSN